jgi:hypothetical protein
MLAAPSGPVAEGLRNSVRFVPAQISSAVFDAALDYSLGDAPRATRRLWPLDLAVDK